jgi:hypothetical protein
MKKLYSAAIACCLLALVFLLNGCMKDSCSNRYTMYTPVMEKLSVVRQQMRSAAPRPMETPGKLYVYGNYVFLNEVGKGIHVIDNTNPAQPRNLSFIPIPGNADLAVRNNYLYADCYSDIVVLNISNPLQVAPVGFLDNAIKENNSFWGQATSIDSVSIITGYVAKDTTVDCGTFQRWQSCPNCMVQDVGRPVLASAPAGGSTGTGGSMARFTILNNYLYAVSSSSLYAFGIQSPAAPQPASSRSMGWGIETIYPFKNRLFIGSITGMFIYDVANGANPQLLGQFNHARACDPVIADDNYAYVTLRSGTNCRQGVDQLDIIDVTNLSAPVLRNTLPMTNPHGLSKDGNHLLLCDGTAGLKLFTLSNPTSPQLVHTFPGIETYDVIAMNNRALVVAKDGLYQFGYGSGTLQLISKMSISK